MTPIRAADEPRFTSTTSPQTRHERSIPQKSPQTSVARPSHDIALPKKLTPHDVRTISHVFTSMHGRDETRFLPSQAVIDPFKST
jgi:hypothetical protein